jgi:DNA repair protein RadC
MSKSFKVGEVKLTYGRTEEFRGQIRTPDCTIKFLRQLIHDEVIEHHEEFWVLFVNHAHKIIGFQQLSVGGLAGCVVDVRHLYQAALLTNASKIIVCHNHPSGNLNPSQPDIEITQKIKECGKILDIQLLDHVILTSDSYMSFAEEGRL